MSLRILFRWLRSAWRRLWRREQPVPLPPPVPLPEIVASEHIPEGVMYVLPAEFKRVEMRVDAATGAPSVVTLLDAAGRPIDMAKFAVVRFRGDE